MWGFVIIAGTFSWLTLFKIIKMDTEDDPSPDLYTYEKEHQCGLLRQPEEELSDGEILIGEVTEWKSFSQKGRRRFVGEVLAGLTREERGKTLRFFREHLDYIEDMSFSAFLLESLLPTVCQPYRQYFSFPLCYYTYDLPERVKRRIIAPVVWGGAPNFSVTYAEWAHAVCEWYTPAAQPDLSNEEFLYN